MVFTTDSLSLVWIPLFLGSVHLFFVYSPRSPAPLNPIFVFLLFGHTPHSFTRFPCVIAIRPSPPSL